MGGLLGVVLDSPCFDVVRNKYDARRDSLEYLSGLALASVFLRIFRQGAENSGTVGPPVFALE
jgi:hypothetical protein